MAGIEEWLPSIGEEFTKDYYKKLGKFVNWEYQNGTVYPPKEDIFAAFRLTPLSKVKVVILGQDPYHEPGQAHGLCFSVKPGTEIPPSLVNIYKELASDLGCEIPNNGYLVKWAEQGVLLLNAVLTVRAHAANSHKGKGWEQFTDRVIELMNEKETPVVFLLWGRNARDKKALVTNSRHLVLESAHPSPLSAYNGFFGNGHFKKCNEFLIKTGQEPIKW